MLASLRCPTCSGPLDVPAAHGRTLKCPYCGANVLLTERPGSVEAADAEEQHARAIAEVLRQLRAGNTIGAVKAYRQHLGGGLKEAKGAVERLAAGQPAGSVPVTVSAGRALGCVFAAVLLLVIGGALAGVFAWRRATRAVDEVVRSLPTPPSIPTPGMPPAPPPEAPGFAREVLRFGSEGTGAGRFEDARSVAVDGAGRIYVAEYQGGRVQVFDSLGTFLTQWMVDPEMPTLDLEASRDGAVYVVQSGRIRRHDGATGERLAEIAPPGGASYRDLAVALDGTLYAVAHPALLVHLSREGRVLDRVDLSEAVGDRAEPERVAVSGTGEAYVLDQWTDEVYRLSRDGRFVDRFGGNGDRPDEARPDHLQSPADLAIDGRGRLYVSDLGQGIRVFDGGGHFLDAVGGGVVFGMAFNDRDELFAALRNDHAVVKYRLVE